MPPLLPPHLRALVTTQHHMLATWQLNRLERRAANYAVRQGHWSRPTTRTLLTHLGDPTQDQLLWAALLHGGSQARAAGLTALALHGWSKGLEQPFHVAVPHRVQPAPAPHWVLMHRMTNGPTGPAAVPARVSVHVAVAQASAWARTDREAMFIVISALQQGLTSPARLVETLEQMPRLPRRRLTAEVAREFAGGVQSLNELDFGALCLRFGVPEPVRQTRVLDARGKLRAIDAEFRASSGKAIRVEIEGLGHLNPEDYFADVNRSNDLALSNPAVGLRITTWHLKYEPSTFMRNLRRAVVGE
jgi:hypothetical protein